MGLLVKGHIVNLNTMMHILKIFQGDHVLKFKVPKGEKGRPSNNTMHMQYFNIFQPFFRVHFF